MFRIILFFISFLITNFLCVNFGAPRGVRIYKNLNVYLYESYKHQNLSFGMKSKRRWKEEIPETKSAETRATSCSSEASLHKEIVVSLSKVMKPVTLRKMMEAKEKVERPATTNKQGLSGVRCYCALSKDSAWTWDTRTHRTVHPVARESDMLIVVLDARKGKNVRSEGALVY